MLTKPYVMEISSILAILWVFIHMVDSQHLSELASASDTYTVGDNATFTITNYDVERSSSIKVYLTSAPITSPNTSANASLILPSEHLLTVIILRDDLIERKEDVSPYKNKFNVKVTDTSNGTVKHESVKLEMNLLNVTMDLHDMLLLVNATYDSTFDKKSFLLKVETNLSYAWIAGLVVGVLVGCLIIIALIIYLLRKKLFKKRFKPPSATLEKYDAGEFENRRNKRSNQPPEAIVIENPGIPGPTSV